MLRGWLLITALATAYAWATGLGSVRCHAQCQDGYCPPQYQPRLVPVPPQPAQQQPVPQLLPQNNPPSPTVNASVVRVHCGDWSGSGSLVDVSGNRGLVLSAAHVVNPRGERYVVYYNGQRGKVHEVYTDRTKADLCAFDVDLPTELAALPVSSIDPQRNDTVTTIGYGGGRLGWWNCRFLREFQEVGGQRLYELSGVVNQGDSGGPVLNSQWQVCGVISGRNDEAGPQVIGPGYQTTCEFIARARAKWQGKIVALGEKLNPTNPGTTPGKAPAKPADKPPSSVDPIGDAIGAVGTSLLTKVLIGAGLSSTGAGLGAAVAVWIVRRRIKKRLEKSQPEQGQSVKIDNPLELVLSNIGDLRERLDQLTHRGRYNEQQAEPVVQKVTKVVTPPEPPESLVIDERHHVRYVEVPDNSKDKAWARASEIYVNRYPGAQATADGIQRLRDQILKGELA